jgi:hypothetical protein
MISSCLVAVICSVLYFLALSLAPSFEFLSVAVQPLLWIMIAMWAVFAVFIIIAVIKHLKK